MARRAAKTAKQAAPQSEENPNNEISGEPKQPYDTLLKSLFEGQEALMLPYFLNAAEYVQTIDIEVVRSILRVDRVYLVRYKGVLHIPPSGV